jgi:hypothetical protein
MTVPRKRKLDDVGPSRKSGKNDTASFKLPSTPVTSRTMASGFDGFKPAFLSPEPQSRGASDTRGRPLRAINLPFPLGPDSPKPPKPPSYAAAVTVSYNSSTQRPRMHSTTSPMTKRAKLSTSTPIPSPKPHIAPTPMRHRAPLTSLPRPAFKLPTPQPSTKVFRLIETPEAPSFPPPQTPPPNERLKAALAIPPEWRAPLTPSAPDDDLSALGLSSDADADALSLGRGLTVSPTKHGEVRFTR